MAKSLWGDLSNVEKVRTPAGILREQASILTEATGGILTGIVQVESSNGSFLNELAIKVSALGNYMYTVASAEHQADAIYPVQLWTRGMGRPIRCTSPDDMEKALEQILTSASTKKIIS